MKTSKVETALNVGINVLSCVGALYCTHHGLASGTFMLVYHDLVGLSRWATFQRSRDVFLIVCDNTEHDGDVKDASAGERINYADDVRDGWISVKLVQFGTKKYTKTVVKMRPLLRKFEGFPDDVKDKMRTLVTFANQVVDAVRHSTPEGIEAYGRMMDARASKLCTCCGAELTKKRVCGACRCAFYCSRECQVKDYKPSHKLACDRLPFFFMPPNVCSFHMRM